MQKNLDLKSSFRKIVRAYLNSAALPGLLFFVFAFCAFRISKLIYTPLVGALPAQKMMWRFQGFVRDHSPGFFQIINSLPSASVMGILVAAIYQTFHHQKAKAVFHYCLFVLMGIPFLIFTLLFSSSGELGEVFLEDSPPAL